MKKLLILAMIVGLAGVFALPAVAVKAPPTLNFKAAAKSPVSFDHAGHEVRIGDCKTCHHMGVGNGSCTQCHGVTDQAPGTKRAFHKSCRGCHTKMKVANYRDCAFCHK